jgi:TRAP-type C4-dicarboxylate transport system substrate-binding protein
MIFIRRREHWRAGLAAGAVLLAVIGLGRPAAAEEKTYRMKMALPTINDTLHQVAKNYGAALERDSGGRIKVEIYPASQLGPIPRQIEGVQFGAVQAAFIPPEYFSGIDERFEIMAAPGLVDSMEHGQRVAADPAVLKLMLGLGANKGLHGVGVFMAIPNSLIAKRPVRRLADLKGKKIRILASEFQSLAFERLGASPVAMTLGDVLPAIHQGAIDGAIAGLTVFTTMKYQDAAKYVTEIGQPAIFIIIEVSKKWYDSLPADLQRIVDNDGMAESQAISSYAIEFNNSARKVWLEAGGELIALPAEDQSSMLKTISSVAEDVSKKKPELNAAYKIVTDAAARTR